MDRFTEQTAANLAGNHARHRFAEEIYESVTHPLDGPKCQNCGATVDRVTLVPQFDYLGCDDCMQEALNQIAREEMLAELGCTPEEVAAFETFPRKQIARQGDILPEVA